MRKLFFLLNVTITIILCACSKDQKRIEKNSSKEKVLFIVSNQHTYGDTKMNTANHFGEIALAYDVFINEGYQVDFVSPQGGAIPLGYLYTSDSIEKMHLYDSNFMNKLKHTFKPQNIDPGDYEAVYYSGGGSAMFGVPENEEIQNIAINVYRNNGIVSAICHGTAGIVNLKDENGNYLYKGKQVNGFPDMFEDKEASYYKTFPFSIEEIIKERGGNFLYSKDGWDNYYIVDGRLITGQDPTGAASIAKEIVKSLKKQKTTEIKL